MADYVQIGLQTTLQLSEMLESQARAVWPHEKKIILNYFENCPNPKRILDVGSGTGQITSRLADLFPEATVYGIDLVSFIYYFYFLQ